MGGTPTTGGIMTITNEGLALIAAVLVACTALVVPFLVVLTLIQAAL